MSEKIDDGGPAFPVPGGFWDKGMSRRDWFAGQALIGLCQADMSEEQFTVNPDLLARTAYRMADAMLAAKDGGVS